MARLTPDLNDGYVWLLNETSGVYRNTGNQLPNNALTDLTVSGTVIRTGTGNFNDNCLFIPGSGNFPTGSSATRNYIFGASGINPQPPFSLSCWINLRAPITGITHLIGKLFRDHATTNTFASPFWAVEMSHAATNAGKDLNFAIANGITSQTSILISDFQLPLHQWAHVGLTHDGTAIRTYLNGCQLMTYTSGVTQLLSTAATSSVITYQDVNYSITSSTGTYVPGTTDIGNHGDEVMTTVALPFNFTIYGATFSSANVSSNGFIEFGQATQGFNWTIPSATFGITVSVFQKDEDTSTGAFGIFTSTTGTAPNRVFNIEWRNRPFGSATTLNYEIRLFENSTTFEVIYDTSTATITGSIGIQSAAGGKSTIFNNATTIPAAGTRLIFTPTLSAPGSWVIGATPLYLVTSSATKEEANYSIQDIRVANVVRPLSYFKNIYKVGALPLNLSTLTQYYKLRAYDTSCVTPTPVVWIDTQISLANAPAFPCSGPYSAVEVLDTWMV